MMNKKVPDSFHNAVTEAIKEVENMNSHKKSNNKILRRTLTVLIAAVLLSCTAFACSEVYNNWFQKTGNYSGKVVATDNEVDIPDYISFELGYLPEGMSVSKTEAPYKYDYNGGFGLSFNFWRVDSLEKNHYKNVVSTESLIVGDKKVEILTINNTDNKTALIYFEDKGVVVECYYNNAIEKADIIKIFENLKLVETTESNAIVFDGTNKDTSLPADYVSPDVIKFYKMGEVCENGFDPMNNASFSVQIIDCKVIDNANSINKENINSSINNEEYIDEDGSIKPYIRENIEYGDGVNTVDTVISSETVQRKMIAVTMNVENISENDGELACSFRLRNKDGEYIATEIFALSGQKNDSRFYFVQVEAGESKTVTAYYIVDEDVDFNDLYTVIENFNINATIPEDSYMKIDF